MKKGHSANIFRRNAGNDSIAVLARYHMLFSALIAIGLSVLSYALIFGLSLIIKSRPESNLHFITSIFLKRGWIPYVEVFSFWTAIMGLLLRLPLINREYEGFKLRIFPPDLGMNYGVAMGRKILANIQSLPPAKQSLMLVNRVKKAIGRLVNTSDTSQMDAVLKTVGEMDREAVDSSYTMVRYLIWLIPTVGFIGTVLGISLAIAQFPALIMKSSGAGMDAVRGGLVDICRQLGVAFDTTLLALLMSAVIAYVMGLIRKKDDQLIADIDEYCIENIVSRVISIDAGSNVILEGIKQGVKEMRLAIDEHGQNFMEKLEEIRLGETTTKPAPPAPAFPAPGAATSAEASGDIDSLVQSIENSRADFQKREKLILEKMEKLITAGGNVSRTVSEMKEFQNFSGLLEKQSRCLSDIENTLTLQQQTMEQTSITLKNFSGLAEQMDELKKILSATREMISQNVETVKTQKEITSENLKSTRKIAGLEAVLTKNEQAITRLAAIMENFSGDGGASPKTEESDSDSLLDFTESEEEDDGEIFLPED